MSITVKPDHALTEIIGRKMFAFELVPPKEQKRMVSRAIKASVEWAVDLEAQVKALEEENRDLNAFVLKWNGHDFGCELHDEGSPTIGYCSCGYQADRDKVLKQC